MFIAIVDDEEEILKLYDLYITELFDKYKVNGEIVVATTDYEKFINVVESGKADLCIIDINLRCYENGMSLAHRIRKSNNEIKIIFFTGCFEYAQLSYEVRAYWFIHKPDWDLLKRVLLRLNTEMELQKPSLIHVECNTGNPEEFGNYFVSFNNINYIDRCANKTRVHTKKNTYGKDTYLTKEGIESLANRINEAKLVRCHRSFYINANEIEYIDYKCTYIMLRDGTRCDIGPNYRNYFKDWRPL